MKTRNLVTLSSLTIVCFISFAFSAPQDNAVKHENPVDEMLQEFSAAVSTLDTKRLEALFLPPDETLDGKNRKSHLEEMEKDWKMAKEKKEIMNVAFKNTVITIRSEMFVGGDEAEAKSIPVEFKMSMTKDGFRIVAMDYLK